MTRDRAPFRYLLLGKGITVIQNQGFLYSTVNRACRDILAARVPYEERKHFFVDLSKIDGFDTTATDVLHYVTYMQQSARVTGDVWRMAWYAPEDAPGFGLARMVASFASPYEELDIEVFVSADDALEWLGAPCDYAAVAASPDWRDIDPKTDA